MREMQVMLTKEPNKKGGQPSIELQASVTVQHSPNSPYKDQKRRPKEDFGTGFFSFGSD